MHNQFNFEHFRTNLCNIISNEIIFIFVEWSSYGPGKLPCSGEGTELGGEILPLEGCKDFCYNTPSCNAFAWRSSSKNCYIKYQPSNCNDMPCQWNYKWGEDTVWNWYWMTCKGIVSQSCI